MNTHIQYLHKNSHLHWSLIQNKKKYFKKGQKPFDYITSGNPSVMTNGINDTIKHEIFLERTHGYVYFWTHTACFLSNKLYRSKCVLNITVTGCCKKAEIKTCIIKRD